MRRQLVAAIRALLVLTVLCGVLYPLAVTALAQLVLDDQADGSLVTHDGEVVGSRLLGQQFASDEWFHPRPSAAGDGYDGAASSASNLGPTNEVLLDAVEERAAAFREENGLPPGTLVPVDAVTASASGLDPHISIANAELQVARVALARSLDADVVRQLVHDHVDEPLLGVLGERGVHVLLLNRALEDLAGAG